MKLIIEIDEDYYKAIWENGYIYDEDNEDVAKIIKDGIPLEEELEKIKVEIEEISITYHNPYSVMKPMYDKVDTESVMEIIDKHIKELKGEQE